MTTTDIYQGLHGAKNSSRVLAAPGGQSSISFGDDPASRANRNRRNESSMSDDQDMTAHGKRSGGAGAAADSHSAIFGDPPVVTVDESQGAKKATKGQGMYNPTTGDGQRSGYNPVTGEDYQDHDQVSPRQKYANDQTRGMESTYGEGYAVVDRPLPSRIYKNSQIRGAYNPITGELYDDSPQPAEPAKQASNKSRANADMHPTSDAGSRETVDTYEVYRVKRRVPRDSINPITGEAYTPKKEVHTSTRVRQPPGGASSGSLW